MTPDLERAAKIAFQAQCDVLGLPFDQAAADNTPTTDGLRAALRALLAPGPAVVEAIAIAIARCDFETPDAFNWDKVPETWNDDFIYGRSDYRKFAEASWRAGLNHVIGAEGE